MEITRRPKLEGFLDNDILALRELFGPLANNIFQTPSDVGTPRQHSVYKTDEGLMLSVELPGYKPENVKLEAQARALHIEAKREASGAFGEDNFSQKFVLAEVYDGSTAVAHMEDGLLTVVVKVDPREARKEIKINVEG